LDLAFLLTKLQQMMDSLPTNNSQKYKSQEF
jgi:hypothetical protein